MPARPIPARRRTTAAVILIAALAATGCAALANDQTAGTTKAVLEILDEMAGPAMRNLDEER